MSNQQKAGMYAHVPRVRAHGTIIRLGKRSIDRYVTKVTIMEPSPRHELELSYLLRGRAHVSMSYITCIAIYFHRRVSRAR